MFPAYHLWFKERFPAAHFISGFLTFYTMISIARYFVFGESLSFSFIDVLGCFAYTGQLLLLRILDEHKDYDIDIVNHPERALSRGLITLRHLKILAIPLPILAIVWTYFSAKNFIFSFSVLVILYIYGALMTKEFFIGEWLKKRLLLYSASHILISPLMIFWLISTLITKLQIDINLGMILFLSITSGLSYEYTRKTRGEDEDPNLDSYNKVFGLKLSIAIITVLNLLTLFISAYLLNKIKYMPTTQLVILIIGHSCTYYPTISILKKKTEKTRKLNEGGLGLFILSLYIAFLTLLF